MMTPQSGKDMQIPNMIPLTHLKESPDPFFHLMSAQSSGSGPEPFPGLDHSTEPSSSPSGQYTSAGMMTFRPATALRCSVSFLP